jgi:hypothetical protein
MLPCSTPLYARFFPLDPHPSVRSQKGCFHRHLLADGCISEFSNPGCRSFVALPRAELNTAFSRKKRDISASKQNQNPRFGNRGTHSSNHWLRSGYLIREPRSLRHLLHSVRSQNSSPIRIHTRTGYSFIRASYKQDAALRLNYQKAFISSHPMRLKPGAIYRQPMTGLKIKFHISSANSLPLSRHRTRNPYRVSHFHYPISRFSHPVSIIRQKKALPSGVTYFAFQL